ncbi:TIGR03085 family metal-binding protein [Nocardioides sp. P5_C9_2]
MSLARAERHSLADTALAVGPDAPTLCGGWDVRQLLAHLLVREHSVLGAAGIALPPLAGLTERAMRRTADDDFDVLVERFRHPRLTPVALKAVDDRVNPVEFFVHHEDLRRAQPGWEPRELTRHDQDVLWTMLRLLGRGLVAKAGVPVRAERTDTHETATLRRGDEPVTVHGPPSELVLFLHGREQTFGVDLTGPTDRIARLRGADRGL